MNGLAIPDGFDDLRCDKHAYLAYSLSVLHYSWGRVILIINQTVDYMARGFMSFMWGVDITRAIGRVGLKVEPVLGPEIARATATFNPTLPMARVMSVPHIKLIKPRAI